MSGERRGKRDSHGEPDEHFEAPLELPLSPPSAAAAAAAAAAFSAVPSNGSTDVVLTRMTSGRFSNTREEFADNGAIKLPAEELMGASACDSYADRAPSEATTALAAEWPGLRSSNLGAEKGGAPIDAELLQYAHWVSTRASVSSSLEQKLAALSRRSVQEHRRAEIERNELARRMEVLEGMCVGTDEAPGLLAVSSQRMEAMQANLDELRFRLGGAQPPVAEPVERTVERLVLNNVQPALGQMAADVAVAVEQQINGAIEDLTKDVGDLRQSLRRLDGRQGPGQLSLADSTEADTRFASASTEQLVAQLRSEWEPALAMERQAAQERLTANCSELTRYLNELREEVIEQRSATERAGKQVHACRQELSRDIAARDSRLEAKLVDLGGQLAARMEDTVAAAARALKEHFVQSQQASSRPSLEG